jgi:hypothetical protein
MPGRGVQEVANFARCIVHTLNLPKNYGKPGWKFMTPCEMRDKLKEEFEELMYDLCRLHRVNGYTSAHELTEIKKAIAAEATDLGAVCMMIADNVGGLKERGE